MLRSRTPPSSTPGRPYGLLRSLGTHKPFYNTPISPNRPDSIVTPEIASMLPGGVIHEMAPGVPADDCNAYLYDK